MRRAVYGGNYAGAEFTGDGCNFTASGPSTEDYDRWEKQIEKEEARANVKETELATLQTQHNVVKEELKTAEQDKEAVEAELKKLKARPEVEQEEIQRLEKELVDRTQDVEDLTAQDAQN